MFSAGTTFAAASITWRRSALPPTSCRTLGYFDFSRVPFPAAMMAIANDGLDMGSLSLYHRGEKAKSRCLAQKRARHDKRNIGRLDYVGHQSATGGQRHQLCGDAIGGVACYTFFLEQKVTNNRLHSQSIDGFSIDHDLRRTLQRVLGFQVWRERPNVQQSDVKDVTASMIADRLDVLGSRESETLVRLRH